MIATPIYLLKFMDCMGFIIFTITPRERLVYNQLEAIKIAITSCEPGLSHSRKTGVLNQTKLRMLRLTEPHRPDRAKAGTKRQKSRPASILFFLLS